MATEYRCCLLSGGTVVGVAFFVAERDATALLEAGKILRTSNGQTVELWDGIRMVSILGKDEDAA